MFACMRARTYIYIHIYICKYIYICQGDTKHLRNSNPMQTSEMVGTSDTTRRCHMTTLGHCLLLPYLLCVLEHSYALRKCTWLGGSRLLVRVLSTLGRSNILAVLAVLATLATLATLANNNQNESLWMHHDAKLQALCLRSWHLPANPQRWPQPICVHLHLRSENDKAKWQKVCANKVSWRIHDPKQSSHRCCDWKSVLG